MRILEPPRPGYCRYHFGGNCVWVRPVEAERPGVFPDERSMVGLIQVVTAAWSAVLTVGLVGWLAWRFLACT